MRYSRAGDSIENLSVSVGESVLLPCNCSEDTEKLVWQIGEDIVVNHCCEYKDPLHEYYVNRTQVFLRNTKKNCSLHLRDVSLNDSRKFTCWKFDAKGDLQEIHEVGLNVTEPHIRFAVGVPVSLLLLILTGLVVVLLIRKHQHPGPRMMQAGVKSFPESSKVDDMLNVKALKIQHFSGIFYHSIATTVLELEAVLKPVLKPVICNRLYHHTEA
ncbi:hypothetical protein Baya_5878 [Bagarius yarrelli]|uniref:Immunoglobulin V-set domain-containing protein n=1 Tax=Bagarius yarrelli TaxID=175774 RepID=A0A556TXU8_BAGYA|nr:hypothetical protein Baya_5878 [Bagarius yarrelli]